jgi:hypothetical protein
MAACDTDRLSLDGVIFVGADEAGRLDHGAERGRRGKEWD